MIILMIRIDGVIIIQLSHGTGQILNLSVDQTDEKCDSKPDSLSLYFSSNNYNDYTALSAFSSFLYSTDFISSKTVAVIPRGFGFSFDCEEDHHLLQIGYNLDHTEKFIEKGKIYNKNSGTITPKLVSSASSVDSGYVSWETYTILKDNDTRRNYYFGEIVSGLSGSDLEIIQPPFAILPKNGENAGALSSSGILTKEFEIRMSPLCMLSLY